MTFAESIQTCFSKYATFTGRARRPEYWWWMLFVILVSVATAMVSDVLSGLFSLATLVPYVAVTARRLHDIGKSGWWQLLNLIPIIGWILMIVWLARDGQGDNAFGSSLSAS